MKTIQHKSTGAIIRVDEVAPKTIYGTVTDNPKNHRMVRIGDKIKTSPNAIGVTYEIIEA